MESVEVKQHPAIQAAMPDSRAFECRTEDGALHHAIVSRDEIAPGDLRWHVSVSVIDPDDPNDVPVWRNLVSVGHRLRPGVVFCVGVPPQSWWMNVHPGVLHLYELRDVDLIDQWRRERTGHAPT